MNENARDLMSRILEFEPDTPLVAIQEEINQLADEVLFQDQPTVKEMIQGLYELTQAENIITDDEPITLADYQDLIYQQVDLLAEILGIELVD